jgi:hypothetical protein
VLRGPPNHSKTWKRCWAAAVLQLMVWAVRLLMPFGSHGRSSIAEAVLRLMGLGSAPRRHTALRATEMSVSDSPAPQQAGPGSASGLAAGRWGRDDCCEQPVWWAWAVRLGATRCYRRS